VSVENRKHGLPRARHLQAAPAAVRLLSVEPLLEDLGSFDLAGIAWVIVGGESGPGARPMQPAWVRSVRALCRRGEIPFFSSSGAALRRACLAGGATAAPTTRCRR
jgi:protein gp37